MRKKTPGISGFIGKLYHIFNEDLKPILHYLFLIKKKEGKEKKKEKREKKERKEKKKGN